MPGVEPMPLDVAEHNRDTDEVREQADGEEGSLVAVEEYRCCSEADDRHHIGEMVGAAGNHRNC